MVVFIKGKVRVDPLLKGHQVLWRYLDAAKFLDLVHSKTLFFTRGDQFEDKFEGAFTKSIKHSIEQSYSTHLIDFTFDEFKKRLRERVFLNCWHANADDSMAMWSIYGRSTSAVAITTTVQQLKDTIDSLKLPLHISIAKVEYVKHWRDPNLKINPYSNVFAYKVKAYEFEKEVRIIIDRFHGEFNETMAETGMAIPVPLDKLLRNIVVAPEAPQWFFDAIKGISARCDVIAPVHRSKLSGTPI